MYNVARIMYGPSNRKIKLFGFTDILYITNSLEIVTVKEILKSANI